MSHTLYTTHFHIICCIYYHLQQIIKPNSKPLFGTCACQHKNVNKILNSSGSHCYHLFICHHPLFLVCISLTRTFNAATGCRWLLNFKIFIVTPAQMFRFIFAWLYFLSELTRCVHLTHSPVSFVTFPSLVCLCFGRSDHIIQEVVSAW